MYMQWYCMVCDAEQVEVTEVNSWLISKLSCMVFTTKQQRGLQKVVGFLETYFKHR